MDKSIERFYKKIEKTDGCWIWKGAKTKNGQGHTWFDRAYRQATHVSFYLYTGHWPENQINHTCDNPTCVRPDHLWEGTQLDNMRDMMRKGRHAIVNVRGERNPKAKLNRRQVEEIRNKFKQGIIRADLAREYNVNWTTINNIVMGIRWI